MKFTVARLQPHRHIVTFMYLSGLELVRDVNKTFSSRPRPRLLFQDQDQDQAWVKTKAKSLHLKTKTKTIFHVLEAPGDQDQGLEITSLEFVAVAAVLAVPLSYNA